MSVTSITSKAQFDELVKSGKPVALQAHASWCGPCRVISPVFEDHAKTHADKDMTFAKFDTDEVADLAQELGVRSIPAFFFFRGGEKSDSLVGANPGALKTAVDKLAA
ncbi:hypothetical protein HIM_03743 [Hirsutella minnesotensis 3608]|uniref:Thioredoxin n=1 Tax=Hirsutella minnesotensis 3608 TaxID=1043627 RepID=A0A0F7ZM14_9HYPO|nr:hypothetical protein HIM_03743 [Hirsutella minnesotensis 3608]